MGIVDVLLEYVLRFTVYSLRSVVALLKAAGTRKWLSAEATVTAQPTVSRGFEYPVVEVVYSYRVDGELYTGLHEEPFLLTDSVADYVARFSSGRTFVVRIKPNEPGTSVVRERDQAMQTTKANIGASRP